MSVETLKQQVQALTPDGWLEFFAWCGTVEHARRQAQPLVDQAQVRVMEEIWKTAPDLKPACGDGPETAKPWKQPQGAHDAYPPEAYVAHGGFTWMNILGCLNPHEPGNDGGANTWAKIITDPEIEDGAVLDGKEVPDPAEGALPWLVGLELKTGDTVTFQGTTYEVLQDHTSSEDALPGQDDTLYKKV